MLALAQRAEARSPYEADADATPAMAADERIHEEVVRGLATRGRNRLSGTFRAAVFGANDGLVSNLALVLGISASGVDDQTVLLTGLAGLLAGALSMGAGEYVSVRSQRELLEASAPDPGPLRRCRTSMSTRTSSPWSTAREVWSAQRPRPTPTTCSATTPWVSPARSGDAENVDEHEAVGTGLGAALSSFCFFASGAVIPVLPYLFGLQGTTALVVATVLVGIALLVTGATVGLLSGGPPLQRALRQLAIGYGAAAVTYLLGLLFGAGLA